MAKMIKIDGWEVQDLDIWTFGGKITGIAKPPLQYDQVLKKSVPDPRYVKIKNSVQNMVLKPVRIHGGNTLESYVQLRNELTGQDVLMRYEDFLLCLEKLGIHNNYITGLFTYRRYYGVYATPLIRD